MNGIFIELSEAVMEHIFLNNCGKETVRCYRECFENLGLYLAAKAVDYSPEQGRSWLSSADVYKTKFALYSAAVKKLDDLYLYGEIRKWHYDPDKTIAGRLSPEYRALLEGIKASIATLASDTIERHVRQCASILLRFQDSGINSICIIRYEDLFCEFYSSKDKPYHSKCAHHASLKLLLQYLYDQGLCPYGFTLFTDAMSKGTGCCWNKAPEGGLEELRAVKNAGTLDLDGFLDMRDELYRAHSKEGYSGTALLGILRITNLLYLFMDMNGLRYCPAVGSVWLNSIKHGLDDKEFKHFRRIVCLLEKQFEGVVLDLKSAFVFKDTLYDRIPDWCRPVVDEFLRMKTAEGRAPSTIRMYKACVCRFCFAIGEMGAESFRTISAADVKRFNLNDRHATPAGKNAYNSRIKVFLQYLSENGLAENHFLFLALPCVCAARETLVMTLTKGEQERLRDIFQENDTAVSLRGKAMIQLGLYMGIRESDIISLTIDDIDWDNAAIRILQDKTDYEVALPMPVPVANALYRYIMKERPEMPARDIFIRKHAPFCKVGKGACRNELKKALPERSTPGSGFHVTRKTYATNLLDGDVTPQHVAEALGHRGLESVHRYLSLDERRMRLCGLSLAEKGLLMKGGFCHA